MEVNSITLRTLNEKIQEVTENAFPQSVWVIAEILEMQVNRSGHCYMELIEKSKSDNSIIAKNRATIWSSRFNMVRSYFETTTRTKLEPGIKVLLKTNISFHSIYGLSLNITDIDPSFTIGDIAVKKQEVINKLHAAGIIEMNKELTLAEVPQRIAVISSETAAGFGDFLDSLINNNSGFSFKVTLFPAIVQGETAEKSIISALEKIFQLDSSFDAVVLIRGGGSQSDLDCFNGLELAMNIAQFPLPVLTGIGHERDETIADIVAHQSLKTPTAVAEYLLDKTMEFSVRVKRLQERFEQSLAWIIQKNRMALQQKSSDLHHLVKQYLVEETHILNTFQVTLRQDVEQKTRRELNLLDKSRDKMNYLCAGLFNINQRSLETFSKTLLLLSPEKVLARGYSISYVDGKSIKSVKNIQAGTKIETKILDGSIVSKVEKVTKSKLQ
ncbi:MAG: exodeoxyribonuclease VII large subunit [Bacteroidales bacterium]|jgi:exodeoxyribonuclease VII large subunit|nr:exodeoxyribonuclease VII large subunit [Bacteroidales bacterium]